MTPVVDWALLAAIGIPAIATLRIGMGLERLPAALERVAATAHDLVARHPRLVAIEIDHDSPTRSLASYARFLGELRSRLPRGVALHATALPTWLSSPDFGRLAPVVDELVMQVHALEGPLAGLFDPDRAYRWTMDTARRTRRPFRIALPTYGSRAVLRAEGGILAVESEVSSGTGLAPGVELAVSPAAVAAFLSRLERSPPPDLLGLAWFRLPLPTDERAWSPTTWRAILRRETPSDTARITLRPTARQGVFDLVASADPIWDTPLPQRIELDAPCPVGDGANGYSFRAAPAPSFSTQNEYLLRAGRSRTLGWVRCEGGVPPPRAVRHWPRVGSLSQDDR